MTRKKTATKAIRQQYSAEFKQQALQRDQRDGVVQAAQDTGLKAQQLYTCRAKAQQNDAVSEEQRNAQAELAKFKRGMARLTEENEFLKKRQVLRQGIRVTYAAIR
jgi:transposase-like protein